LVEVILSSHDLTMLIEYYTFIFGTGKLKPKDDDIRMIRKLETMRDATVLEEEFMGGITKSK
jgi:hypothetical protein